MLFFSSKYGMLLLYPLQRSATSGVGSFSQFAIVRAIAFIREGAGEFEPRSGCNVTEQLFDEMEEEHARLKRDLQVLEHDIAACKRQLEET
jgi:hypothetical protein